MIDIFSPLCAYGYCIMHPIALIAAIIAITLTIILLNINFITFKNKEEKKEFLKDAKAYRILLAVSRSIILAALFIAIAYPYKEIETTTPGNPSVTILADNSTSFDLFEKGIAEGLQSKLN